MAPEAASELATGTLPTTCHRKIWQIHDYWISIHPDNRLPGRQHFDPVDVPELLPNICLLHCPSPETDFTFRLIGTHAEKFFGANFTGKLFTSAYVKAEESRSYKDAQATCRDGLLRWRKGPAFFVHNQENRLIERVFLPFAADGQIVDMLLFFILAEIIDPDFHAERRS